MKSLHRGPFGGSTVVKPTKLGRPMLHSQPGERFMTIRVVPGRNLPSVKLSRQAAGDVASLMDTANRLFRTASVLPSE
jgi:hypothetical protein